MVFHIAKHAWPLVLSSINWFQANDLKKKLWLDEVRLQLANGLVKISFNGTWVYRMVGHLQHLTASHLIAHLQSLIERMNM